jgi:hypothetical protein
MRVRVVKTRHRAKSILLPVFLALATAAGLAADPVDTILADAVDSLSTSGAAQVVSLGNFTYAHRNVGSSFSRYFEEKLAAALENHPGFQLFAREQLEEILAAIEISLSDLFDPATAVESGHLRGIQALLGGRYFDEADSVRVYLTLIDVQSGLVTAGTQVVIPKVELPDSLSVLPENYNDALSVIEELSRIQDSDPADFQVKLWTVRGEGATYRGGEELVIHLYSTRDCYVKIYQIDVERQVQLIFPNRFFPDNFIRNGRVYKIPDTRYPFRFVLGEPFGMEFVKLIASTLQFEEIEEDFQVLGSPSKDVITRGLSIRQRNDQLVEAMISYTIVQ